MAINKRLLVKPPSTGITPSEHFGVVLYEGDGSTSHSINGGKFGAAGYFNGSSGFVSVTTTSTTPVDFSARSYSLSLWVNSTTTTLSSLLSKYGDTDAARSFTLLLQANGTIRHYERATGTFTQTDTTGTVNDGNWHHVVVTKSSTATTIYIDGSSDIQNSNTFTSNNGGTEPFRIGRDNTGSPEWFNGKIDQVRIFTKALSSSEVSTLYVETLATSTSLDPLSEDTTDTLQVLGDSSCIATYRFENDEDDLSGNYDGTGTEIQYAAGRYGQAASFNGSTSKVNTSATLDTYTSNGGSISFWFKTSQTTPFQAIIGSQTAQNGASNGTTIFIGDTTSTATDESISVWDFNGGTTSAFFARGGSTTYQNGNWHHVVVTSTSTTKNIYIDGVSQSISYTASGSASANLKFTDIQFGTSLGYGSNYFDGQLDQVRIFNKAISASEVTTLYNENSLVASYRFEGNANDDTRNYDGTASNVTYEYGLGFTPDFVWLKERSAAESHRLFDTTRGATKRIFPDTGSAESTATDSLTSFDTGGFTVGSSLAVNQSGQDYVAWCLKANGGTTSSNTDGSITSTVQANQDAGFSIVKYTAGSGSFTAGHGLSSAPEIVFYKNLDVNNSWAVWVTGFTDKETLYLDATSAKVSVGFTLHGSIPTATTIGGSNWLSASGANVIAYCFHSVDGFSKIGTYVGNGSTDGPIVETGFEPAFVMSKNIDNAESWYIWDNKRSATNPRHHLLLADATDAEYVNQTNYALDFLSNGFQLKNTVVSNASGKNYIYIAFAADPDTEAPTVAKSFSTVAYTGTGAIQNIDGLGFQPSLIWIKSRTQALYHFLIDSVRGVGLANSLSSNTTDGESFATEIVVNALDSDGFILNADDGSGYYGWNMSNQDYVAWAWKADDNEPTIDGGSALAVYKFEDNANDVTGNNNGTAYNVTYTSSGKFNKAASFNGSNSYVDTGSQLLQNNKAFTFSLWIRFSTSQTSKTIISRHNDATGGASIGIDDSDANKIKFHLNSYSTQRVNGTTALNDGNWHHIVGTWDTKTLKLYVDGLLDASSTPASTSLTYPALNLRIGSWPGNTSLQYFEGDVDQVRIYSGAVSDIGAAELYAETASQNDDLTLGAPPETIISANSNAGFSIVKYEGDGVPGKQVPHGLSAAPDMVIVKSIDAAYNWMVYHSAATTNLGKTAEHGHAYLNLTNVYEEPSAGVVSVWNDTAPTSTVFSISDNANVNVSGDNYIAYCFHSVSGYSKFGSYSGNGTTQTITTGFQPDWVLIKSATSAYNWFIYDSVRSVSVGSNPGTANARPYIIATSSGAENGVTSYNVNFDSNGFSVSTSIELNGSGQTYIYMAFKIN